MTVYYIETSALLKRYRSEQGTEVLDELLGKSLSDDAFMTSHFTAVEIEAASARLFNANVFSLAAYRLILGRFAVDIAETIIIQNISTSTMTRAAELARNYGLRAGDAIHLAEAVLAREAASEELVFLSSDRELVSAANHRGFTCIDPNQSTAIEQLRQLRI